MKQNVKRINESQLKAIVAEAAKRALKEYYENYDEDDLPYMGPSPKFPRPHRSAEEREKEVRNAKCDHSWSKDWHKYCEKRREAQRKAQNESIDEYACDNENMEESAYGYGRQETAMKRLGYKNPYEGMSWDEYVAAKEKEFEKEKKNKETSKEDALQESVKRAVAKTLREFKIK